MKSLYAALILGALMVPAQAATPRWSCRDIPWWIKSYSHTQVVSAVTSLGMAPWEVRRLLRCLPKE